MTIRANGIVLVARIDKKSIKRKSFDLVNNKLSFLGFVQEQVINFEKQALSLFFRKNVKSCYSLWFSTTNAHCFNIYFVVIKIEMANMHKNLYIFALSKCLEKLIYLRTC